jgi:hypothetical protein
MRAWFILADISDRALGLLVAVSLLVSLFGLFGLQGTHYSYSGYGTVGFARINITASASINVTQPVIDFGNGTVNQGYSGDCVMSSADTSRDPNACFTASYGLKDALDGFHVVNVGNIALNVTVNSTFASNSSFWGVSGGGYLFRCSANTSAIASVITTWTTPNGTALPCADYLNATFGQNEIRMDINISIPQAAVGVHNDTVTFTGSPA